MSIIHVQRFSLRHILVQSIDERSQSSEDAGLAIENRPVKIKYERFEMR
jgi:hypothetical protein